MTEDNFSQVGGVYSRETVTGTRSTGDRQRFSGKKSEETKEGA